MRTFTKFRQLVPGAMLLSLMVHAGLFVLVVGSGGEKRGGSQAERAWQTVMSAYVAKPLLPRMSSSAAIEASERQQVEQPDPELAQPMAEASVDAGPLLEIKMPIGPHYFRPSELTQRPVMLGDAISRLVVEAPGLPPAPVILRLLIGDEGTVDRVVIENSYLPEKVESHIVDAFSKVRFQPGKIGRIAVRSQLRIEVRLENVPDFPAPSLGQAKAT